MRSVAMLLARVLVLSIATALAACAHQPSDGAPVTTERVSLAVKVPRACKAILKKAPYPNVREGDDLGNTARAWRTTAIKANRRIARGAACIDREGDLYGSVK